MQDKPSSPEVPLEKLRWRCDPESFPFDTTADLPPFEGIIGQERAQKALALGVEIARAGYNIYVCGMPGTGRLTAVQQLLATCQERATPPPDLCYVFAFKHPEHPRLFTLQAGQGKTLKKAMEGLISTLKQDIPALYASETFQQRKEQVRQQVRRREQRLLEQFEKRLAPHFGLLWHDADAALVPELAPVLAGRLTLLAELERQLEAGHFPIEQYRHLRTQHTTLSESLCNVLATAQRLRQEAEEAVHTLERALVRPLIQQAVAHAAASFSDPAVQQYFQEVEEALNEDFERFLTPAPASDRETSPFAPPTMYDEDPCREYQVNIIVDNSDTRGAPVIFEMSPTHKNLFGTLEPALEYGGMWRSDFMGIRAGAFHRAQGGYLVFDALDALAEPLVWSTLKRTLRYGRLEIQAFDHFSLVPSTTLKPEPIPCDVKVIMLGDEDVYEALAHEDEAFQRLFKVKADFDVTIPRQPQTVMQYAGLSESYLPYGAPPSL